MLGKCAVCLCLTSVLLATTPVRGAPATLPVEPVDAELHDAIQESKLKTFLSPVEQQIRELLKDPASADAGELTRLAVRRQIAKYFTRAGTLTDKQRELLVWISNRPTLARTLALAVGDQDPPDGVLAALDRLRDFKSTALDQFPELTTAFAVTWDTPLFLLPKPEGAEVAPANFDQMTASFGYFTSVKALRNNLRTLPWQLAIYFPDVRISPEECEAARQAYAQVGSPANAYFDVPFKFGNGLKPFDQPGAQGLPYTLQNVATYGGLPHDAALYAVAVSQALGVPATWFIVPDVQWKPAWVAVLELRGKQAAWNLYGARHEEYLRWPGTMIEPQTRLAESEGRLSVTAAVFDTPIADRNASLALYRCRDLVRPELRVALLVRAVQLSPGNADAWLELAQLGATGKLAAKQSDDVIAACVEKLKRFPEFDVSVRLKLIEGRGNLQRIDLLQTLRKSFLSRPDLVARMDLARADVLRREKKLTESLDLCGQMLAANGNDPALLLAVTDLAAKMLRERDDLEALAEVYRRVWSVLPLPASQWAATTPAYVIGQRYAEVLQTLKDVETLKDVQAKLRLMESQAVKKPQGG